MPTNSFRALGAAVVLAASLCSSACNSSSGQPDGGPLCRQGFPDCDAGTQCTNGICTPTCDATGAGCPTGDYCESTNVDAGLNICSPDQVTVCATNDDCPSPQNCSPGGICTVVELQANGSEDGCLASTIPDECAPDSLCYESVNSTDTGYINACVGLAHCSEDGGCPNSTTNVGVGSVCNQLADGGYLFPGKERLCLYGYCVDDTHCPAGNRCFHRNPADPLGQCQSGEQGDPCYTASDCFNSPQGCEAFLDGGFDGGADDGGSLGQCY